MSRPADGNAERIPRYSSPTIILSVEIEKLANSSRPALVNASSSIVQLRFAQWRRPIENQRRDSVEQWRRKLRLCPLRPVILSEPNGRGLQVSADRKRIQKKEARSENDREGRRGIPTVLRSTRERRLRFNDGGRVVEQFLGPRRIVSFSGRVVYSSRLDSARWHSKGPLDDGRVGERGRGLTIVLTPAIITGKTRSNISGNSAVILRRGELPVASPAEFFGREAAFNGTRIRGNAYGKIQTRAERRNAGSCRICTVGDGLIISREMNGRASVVKSSGSCILASVEPQFSR